MIVLFHNGLQCTIAITNDFPSKPINWSPGYTIIHNDVTSHSRNKDQFLEYANCFEEIYHLYLYFSIPSIFIQNLQVETTITNPNQVDEINKSIFRTLLDMYSQRRRNSFWCNSFILKSTANFASKTWSSANLMVYSHCMGMGMGHL